MQRFLALFSERIARVERALIAVIAIALPLMILLNTAGRAVRSPIYWMDELAILLMVWMALFGISLTIRTRDAVAVTMLLELAPLPVLKAMKVLIDVFILAFTVALLVMCWFWFDPVTLIRVNFDFHAFSGEGFNYIYEDTTDTLDVRKFWFWLMIPFSALTSTVHGLSNLITTVQTPASELKAAMSVPVVSSME
ncbi:MAG: TRAP transporter small permease subunit [Pigmentiphaga sp.]|nr:TRAP transporter small permease subunit [Pigmentiphaga sp.]